MMDFILAERNLINYGKNFSLSNTFSTFSELYFFFKFYPFFLKYFLIISHTSNVQKRDPRTVSCCHEIGPTPFFPISIIDYLALHRQHKAGRFSVGSDKQRFQSSHGRSSSPSG